MRRLYREGVANGFLTAATVADDDLVFACDPVSGDPVLVPVSVLREVYFVDPALARFRAAALNADAQTVNILAFGDSITMGSLTGPAHDCTNYIDDRYLTQLVRLLQTEYTAGVGGVGFVNSFPAINGSAGGTCYPTYSGGGQLSFNTFGGDLQCFGGRQYEPVINEVLTWHFFGTSIKPIHKKGVAGLGAIDWTVDDVPQTQIVPATTGGQHSTGRASSAVFAQGTHTAVFTPASGKIAYVRGVDVKDGDDTNGFAVYEHAWLGIKSSTVLGGTAGLTDQLTVCADPALVIIELGVNDAFTVNPTAAQWKTNILAIIANIKALCTVNPSFVLLMMYDTVGSAWADYVTKAYEIAAADPDNVSVLDLTLVMARPTSGNGWDGGLVHTDGTHPTSEGHAAIGQYLFDHVTV